MMQETKKFHVISKEDINLGNNSYDIKTQFEEDQHTVGKFINSFFRQDCLNVRFQMYIRPLV